MILISLLLLLYCGQTNAHAIAIAGLESPINPKELRTDFLPTGWYYVTDRENGIERKVEETGEAVFIAPSPIVTVKHFTKLEIYQSNAGDYGLLIKLNKEGAKAWRTATGESIGKQLALIIDNKVIYTPTVNAPIDAGVTALNRGDLTEAELKILKSTIEMEKKKRSKL